MFSSDHLSVLCLFLHLSIFVSNSCFIALRVSVLARMRTLCLRCWRVYFYIFGPSCPASKMNSYMIRHDEILYMQLNNATYISKLIPLVSSLQLYM